jgi:hypothetical protein
LQTRNALTVAGNAIMEYYNLDPNVRRVVQAEEELTFRQTNFQNWVLQLAVQGYQYLVSWLTSQTQEDVYAIAQQAAGNPNNARALDDRFKAALQVLTGPQLALAGQLIASLSAVPGRGLREASEAIGVTTGTVGDMASMVALVPKITSQMSAVPTANKSKFLADVAAWNAGVPFASGGLVSLQGGGSPDKASKGSLFSAGGLVPSFGLSVPQQALPAFDGGGVVDVPVASNSSSSRTVSNNIVVNNPAAQTAEESISTTMQKLRYLGAFA